MKALRKNRITTFCLYALPILLVYIYFITIPFLETFYYGMTDWNGIGKTWNFIGFDNFKKLFTKDKVIWDALWHNVEFCIYGGIFTFLIAIFNAVVVTQSHLRGWEKKFYRITYFIPNILSTVVVSLLWMFIYNPNWGILNSGLQAVGLDNLTHVWLGEKSTVVPALIVPWVWTSVGFYMILYISAIESIPTSLFEAAEIDGAGSWQKFWTITWPLLKETTKTSLVFFFINAFSGVFTLVNVMTQGGPAKASEVMTNYLYTQAFRMSEFGYGTAIGVMTFFVVLIVSAVLLILTRTTDTIEY